MAAQTTFSFPELPNDSALYFTEDSTTDDLLDPDTVRTLLDTLVARLTHGGPLGIFELSQITQHLRTLANTLADPGCTANFVTELKHEVEDLVSADEARFEKLESANEEKMVSANEDDKEIQQAQTTLLQLLKAQNDTLKREVEVLREHLYSVATIVFAIAGLMIMKMLNAWLA